MCAWVGVRVYVHAHVCMWKSEDNLGFGSSGTGHLFCSLPRLFIPSQGLGTCPTPPCSVCRASTLWTDCLPAMASISVHFFICLWFGATRNNLIILVPISWWPKALFHLDIYSGVEFQFQRAHHTLMLSFSRCPHCVSSQGYISEGRQFSGSWTCGEAWRHWWRSGAELFTLQQWGSRHKGLGIRRVFVGRVWRQ